MAQNGLLQGLIGTQVRINRGGPDAITGTLVAVQHGYLVLKTREGLVYVNAVHIKSVSDGIGSSSSGSRSSRSGRSSFTARYVVAFCFAGVLQQLRHRFVQINRGGPEKLAGVVADVTSDIVLLIVGNELVRIPLYHIKSVTVAGVSSNRSGNHNSSGNKSRSGRQNQSGKSGRSKQGSGRNTQSGKRSGQKSR